MSKQHESAEERIARLQRERAEAAKKAGNENKDLIGQLTHEGDGEPDFSQIAKKLEERKAMESQGENAGFVKMTIYIREDIAASFNALCTKRGQQKAFANQAFQDFVQKKIRELGIE